MEPFSIHPFTAEHLDAAISFFRRVYAPNHIIGKADHLRWQFLDHPDADDRRRSILLFQGASVVGHLGIIPQRTKVGDRIIPGGWCANLIVAPEIRERGAGAFLLREAAKQFDLLLTTGYNAQAAPVLEAQGWTLTPALRRWVSVLRGARLGIPERPLDAVSHAFDVRPMARFDGKWDRAWQKIRGQFLCTTERDSAYLNWRFSDHPRTSYQILGASEQSDIMGYGVLRMERSPELVGARIVDMAAMPGSATAILRGLADRAAAEGADFADFFCSGNWYDSALLEAGFIPADHEPYSGIPTFLLPLDRRRNEITFALWLKAGAVNPADWYVVKADGDKDRPPGNL